MTQNKTQATDASVSAFLQAVIPSAKCDDAFRLDQMFRNVTGWQPRMRGPSIVGYGQYHFEYDSGRQGDFLATGFSPRKANLVLYIMPGYHDLSPWLSRLGKYKLGKSCLYINKLKDIDESVLQDIIAEGLRNLSTRWTVIGS